MDIGNYLVHRDNMQTGDVIAVAGAGLFSKLIRWRTKSAYSHVGMIVRGQGDWVLLLHSTTKYGVHEVPLFRYLQRFKGSAWWVPLDHEKAAEINPHYRSDLLGARREIGREYDYKGVLSYVLPWISQTEAARYCSELIAKLMKLAKLILSNDVDPGELVSQSIFKEPVPLD